MTVSREPRIPIDCPACEGLGYGTDMETCWSCRGSRILKVSEGAFARINGLPRKMERHRLYNADEIAIIKGPGSWKERLQKLEDAGYTDRSYDSIGDKLKKIKEEEARAREIGA